MLTRVDHVMICVPDLARGIDAYQRLGFNIYPGGAHTGRATHNAIAFTGEEYIEVLSIRDRSAVAPGTADEGLARYLDEGGGFRVIAVQSDDLASVHWIGHCASAESFGKAWDTWRTELSDSKSVAAKINERLEKCATNDSRRGYDLY